MIIRGLDFARHTVVVGSDTETATPGNAGQSALPARGDIMARVIATSGGEATLDINGQRVVVETHVALNAGDKLFVRVQQPANGLLRLSILSSEPDGSAAPPALAETDLTAMLRDLGLPVDERTRLAARALVARDGTLDKGNLKALMADLKGFEKVTPREASAAALLQKANAPVNAATVAVVTARAQPDAPPQLASRLTALTPALETLVRTLGARSPVAQQAQELLRTLQGLPLDEAATNEKVVQSLREWLGKLQPRGAADTSPRAATAAAGKPPAAPTSSAPTGATPATVLDELMATLDKAAGEQTNTPATPSSSARTADRPPTTTPADTNDGSPAEAPKQAMVRPEGVSPSQRGAPKVGITKGASLPFTLDLASQLEKLSGSLGSEHGTVGHLLHEAVAELRYTQLANGPAPAGANGQEFLVPLLLPQLSPEHPEGRLQVFQRASRQGEPIDPKNVRFVFVLETEHMNTVQADMNIKEGKVDLSIGVADLADRELMNSHLDELEKAIGDLGFPVGRFGARQAKGPPPPVRQEEGLSDIVRFDRRV
jgi:hypothetical protein